MGRDRGEAALDLIRRQRACRAYGPDPVTDADLAAMLEAATHAPSAENRQPWVFVVVRDAATRGAIADLTRRVWAGGGRQHAADGLAPAFFDAVDDFIGRGYGGAPVLVVVAGEAAPGQPASVLASSVFPAVQNLLLAAAALGYGSSMTTLAAQVPEALGGLVGLPADVRPLAVVPIGRPAAPLGAPRRRPVHEVAHREVYGVPFTAPGDEPAGGRPPAPPPGG